MSKNVEEIKIPTPASVRDRIHRDNLIKLNDLLTYIVTEINDMKESSISMPIGDFDKNIANMAVQRLKSLGWICEVTIDRDEYEERYINISLPPDQESAIH